MASQPVPHMQSAQGAAALATGSARVPREPPHALRQLDALRDPAGGSTQLQLQLSAPVALLRYFNVPLMQAVSVALCQAAAPICCQARRMQAQRMRHACGWSAKEGCQGNRPEPLPFVQPAAAESRQRLSPPKHAASGRVGWTCVVMCTCGAWSHAT